MNKSQSGNKFKKVALSLAVVLTSAMALVFGFVNTKFTNALVESSAEISDFVVDDNNDSLPSEAVAISSREDLLAFLCGTNYWGGSTTASSATYAYLTNDIDFYYHTVDGNSYPSSDVVFAQGKTLDGRGYKVNIKYGDSGNVSGDALTFNGRSNGYTCNIGTLVNLDGTQVGKTTSVTDSVATNLTITGGLLARNDGIIKNVNFVSAGSINAQFSNNNKNTCGVYGGIVGLNRGTISNCSFTIPEGKHISIWKEPGSLRWFDYNMVNLGGFAGISCGTIENSSLNLHGSLEGFSVGWGKTDATGSQYFSNIAVGGFIGAAYGGTVKNVAVTGNGHLYGRSMWTQTKGYIIGTAAGATSNVYVNSGRTQSGYASTMYKGNTGDVSVNGVFVYNANFQTSSLYHSQDYKNKSNYYAQSRWNFTDSEWRNDTGTENYTNSVSLIGDWTADLSSIQNVYFYGTSSSTEGTADTYYSALRRITNGSGTEGKIHDIVFSGLSNSDISFEFSGDGILRTSIDTGTTSDGFQEIVWDASTESVNNVLTYDMVGTNLVDAYSWTSDFKKQVTANRKKYILDLLVSESVINGSNHTTTFTGGTMGGAVTIGNITNTYDGKAHPINTVTLGTGDVISKNNSNFKGVLTGEESPIDADVYTYNLSNGSTGYVYANQSLKRLHSKIGTATATSTITPKGATVVVSGDTGLVYDGEKHEPTVELNGILERDDLTVTKTITKDEIVTEPINAGTYVMRVTITGTRVANYSLEGFTAVSDTEYYRDYEFVIAKKDLSANITDCSNFKYDGTQKIVEASLSGLLGDYTNELIFTGPSNIPLYAGNYVVKVIFISDDFKIDNYNLPEGFARASDSENKIEKNIEFSISPMDLTIEYGNTESLKYSGLTQEPTANINENIISGDSMELVISYEIDDSVEGNNALLKDGLPYNAGKYVINVSLAGESNIVSNYKITNPSNVFEIERANLSIFIGEEAWNNGTFIYNSENHDLRDSISLVGLKDSDSDNEITYSILKNNVEVDEAVDVGDYSIIAKVNGSDDVEASLNNNYVIIYVRNSFSIKKAIVNIDNISFNDESFVYDGEMNLIYISGSLMKGISTDVVYTGGENGENGRTNVGSSTITATITVESENYTFMEGESESSTVTLSAELTVTRKTVLMTDVIFRDQIVYYTGEEISIIPIIPEGMNMLLWAGNPEKNIGTYTFTYFFGVDENHILELEDGSTTTSPISRDATLTIKKAIVNLNDIIFEDVFVDEYDGNLHTIEYSTIADSNILNYVKFNEYVGGEDGANGRINAGTSIITATFGLVDENNYTFMDEENEVLTQSLSATITIERKRVNIDNITFASVEKDYDGTALAVTYSGELMDGIVFSGYKNENEEEINERISTGSSIITANFSVENDNYCFGKNEEDEYILTASKQATITINKLNPTFNIPENFVSIFDYTGEDGIEALKQEINKITSTSDSEIIADWPEKFISIGRYDIVLTTTETEIYNAGQTTISVEILGITPKLEIETSDIDYVYVGYTIDDVKENNFVSYKATNEFENDNEVEGTFAFTWVNADGSEIVEAPAVGDLKAYVKISFTPNGADFNPVYEIYEFDVKQIYININYNHKSYTDKSDVKLIYNKSINEASDEVKNLFVLINSNYDVTWKVGDQDFDFDEKITSNKTLEAHWNFNAEYIKDTKVELTASASEITYGEDFITITANILNPLDDVAYTYVWFKNDEQFANDKNSWEISDVADTGKYKVNLIISSLLIDDELTLSDEVEVQINQKTIEIKYDNAIGKDSDGTDIIASIPFKESIPDFKKIFGNLEGLVSPDDIIVEFYKNNDHKGISPLSLEIDQTEWTKVDKIYDTGKYLIYIYSNNENYNIQAKKFYVYITKEEVLIDDTDIRMTYTGDELVLDVIKDKTGNKLNGTYTINRYENGEKLESVDKILNVGTYIVNVKFEETDKYFGQEKTFFVTIDPMSIEIIWENLDNPIIDGELAIKAYYVDVKGEKVYLDLKGIDRESVDAGKYNIYVTVEDKNYLVDKKTISKEIIIETDIEWLLWALSGLELAILILILAERIFTARLIRLNKPAKVKKPAEKKQRKENRKIFIKKKDLNYKLSKNKEVDFVVRDACESMTKREKAKYEKHLAKVLKKREEDKQKKELALIRAQRERIKARKEEIAKEKARAIKEKERMEKLAKKEAKEKIKQENIRAKREVLEAQKIEKEKSDLKKKKAELDEKKAEEKKAREKAKAEALRQKKLAQEKVNLEKIVLEERRQAELKAKKEQRILIQKRDAEKRSLEKIQKEEQKKAKLEQKKAKKNARQEAKKQALLAKQKAKEELFNKKILAKQKVEERVDENQQEVKHNVEVQEVKESPKADPDRKSIIKAEIDKILNEQNKNKVLLQEEMDKLNKIEKESNIKMLATLNKLMLMPNKNAMNKKITEEVIKHQKQMKMVLDLKRASLLKNAQQKNEELLKQIDDLMSKKDQ